MSALPTGEQLRAAATYEGKVNGALYLAAAERVEALEAENATLVGEVKTARAEVTRLEKLAEYRLANCEAWMDKDAEHVREITHLQGAVFGAQTRAQHFEAENERLKARLARGVRLLRTVHASKDDFAWYAREWLKQVEEHQAERLAAELERLAHQDQEPTP